MKQYKVVVLADAKRDLLRYIDYLRYVKKNLQAARNVMQDYKKTRERLSLVAGSLQDSENILLKRRGLRRMKFLKHDYFLLYKIDGDKAVVMKIFHALEDYENMLN